MMEEILNHTLFTPSLLEECIVQGIFQTLTKRNTIKPMINYSATPTVTSSIQSEDLLLVGVDCLMKHISRWLEGNGDDKNIPYLTRGLVWLLIGQAQLSSDVKLTNEIAARITEFAGKVLAVLCNQLPHYDIIAIESALDCCSLVSH